MRKYVGIATQIPARTGFITIARKIASQRSRDEDGIINEYM
jgi:hypothetical protein